METGPKLQPDPVKRGPAGLYYACNFREFLETLPADKAEEVRKLVDDYVEKVKSTQLSWHFGNSREA